MKVAVAAISWGTPNGYRVTGSMNDVSMRFLPSFAKFAGLVLTMLFIGCGDTAPGETVVAAGNASAELPTNVKTTEAKKAQPITQAAERPSSHAKLIGEETETTYYSDQQIRRQRGVKRYDDGTLINHGDYVTYYESGQKFEEGKFVDGVKEGPWRQWHENGKEAKVEQYVDGKLHGHWTLYNRDGTRQREVAYKHGQRDGRWIYYLDDKPSKQVEYQDGLGHGAMITWYPNGQKKSEYRFERNEPVGKRFEWHPNGQLAAEAEVVNGKIHGLVRAWDASGQLISASEYNSGKLVRKLKGSSEKQPN